MIVSLSKQNRPSVGRGGGEGGGGGLSVSQHVGDLKEFELADTCRVIMDCLTTLK